MNDKLDRLLLQTGELVKKRYLGISKEDEGGIWLIILSLNPFLTKEIPDFDRPLEPNQEYYTTDLLLLSIEKTMALMKEPVIIYDLFRGRYLDCFNFLKRIADYYSINDAYGFYDKNFNEQVQPTFSSVDSIAAPLQDIAQEQAERH